MLDVINETFQLNRVDLRGYSPLALAFIGDSVFATVVKAVLIEHGNCSGGKLHKRSSRYVCAGAQAKMYDLWETMLTEEESDLLRRGRNAKSENTAKHATDEEYRKATGVECLCGYLFLKGEEKRLTELIREGMKSVGEGDSSVI